MRSLTLIVALFAASAYAWVPQMENMALFEGDMVLRPDQQAKYKNGELGYGSKKNRDELWPAGVVPYLIASELRYNSKAMASINAAFAEYKKYTCIRFVPRSNQAQYVEFHKGGGCSSWVGRDTRVRGGRHPISLDSGCWWKATVMHEIAHSLGFYHEQSRPDRDSYIEVLTHNMKSGASSQFQKQTYSTVDSLNTPYDYESMMHYNWNAFGQPNGDFAKQTIRTLDRSKQWLLGQRNGFSKTDVVQINKLYRCSGNYPSPPSSAKVPTDACHDMQTCAEGVAEGNCKSSSWQSWMSKACRFSCGFCNGGTGTGGTGTGGTGTGGTGTGGTGTGGTGTGGGSCKDRVNDCWKNMAKCNSNINAWKDYMKRSCAKSCRHC